jgi:two-component system chemotaxis response regulator CheY
MAFSVLIVDDCRAMHTVLRRMLTIAGFDVRQFYYATDGEDALTVMRGNPVDLVISDINMPRLDGEGMLRCLIADSQLSHIPVVMVTSDATAARAQRLLDLGAKAYLTKPFQPETFRNELERVMEECHA